MDTIADSNNNTSSEKSYSLRPRAALKKEEEDTDHEEAWRPRERTKRKTKQKCLPLSKYRRKTANARERSRMREINEAFEALRRALPYFSSRSENPSEKTTKIMTLRLAMKYITALDSALRQADGDSDADSLSDYTLTSPTSRENSVTPSSLSEQSDILDQLLVPSPFEDCSPLPSHSSALSPFLKETATFSPGSLLSSNSPKIDNQKQSSRLSFNCTTTRSTPVNGSVSSAPSLRPDSFPSFDLTLSTSSHHNQHPDPVAVDPVKECFGPPVTQDYCQSPWRDFDCLPSSPISLDDLFIT